jgi:hypothetical protein
VFVQAERAKAERQISINFFIGTLLWVCAEVHSNYFCHVQTFNFNLSY